MRKPISSLLAASLIWLSGPGPVFARGRAVVVGRTAPSPILGGAPLFNGSSLAGPAAASLLSVPTLGLSSLPVPAWVPPSRPISAPVSAAARAPKTDAFGRSPVAVFNRPTAPPPGAAVETKAVRAPSRSSKDAFANLSRLEDTLTARPESKSAAADKADLDAAFEGGAKSVARTPVRVSQTAFGAARRRLTAPAPQTFNGAQAPLHLDLALAAKAPKSDQRAREPADQEKTRLPKSFYLYLAGQLLYGIGQEAAALVAPLYAYAAVGLEFAVLSQAAMLIAIIPGSILGSRLIRKFDSKKVYLAGNLIHAAFFLSVPVMHLLTGSFSPYHFLAFQAVGGLIYGSLRGVAEKEITPRIIGQGNEGQLKKAGSMFYAVFESAELLTAISFGFMIAALGLNWTSGITAAIMLASVIPLFFMRLRKKAAEGNPEEAGGTEKSLPWRSYVPFVFAIFVHMSLYDFIAPFMALEVFHSEPLASRFIAAYTIGSLAVALLMSYGPALAAKLSSKGWTVVGVGATVAFLWTSLLLQMPWVSLGLAGVLGFGLTGMMIQWRTVYQQRLSLEVQPKVFERLMIASVLMTLVPFAVMQAGLLIAGSSAMVTLLTLVSAGITAGALGYPLLSGLLSRRRSKK